MPGPSPGAARLGSKHLRPFPKSLMAFSSRCCCHLSPGLSPQDTELLTWSDSFSRPLNSSTLPGAWVLLNDCVNEWLFQ